MSHDTVLQHMTALCMCVHVCGHAKVGKEGGQLSVWGVGDGDRERSSPWVNKKTSEPGDRVKRSRYSILIIC